VILEPYIRGGSENVTFSPPRLVFMEQDWNLTQTVVLKTHGPYAGGHFERSWLAPPRRRSATAKEEQVNLSRDFSSCENKWTRARYDSSGTRIPDGETATSIIKNSVTACDRAFLLYPLQVQRRVADK
jgi:hypothetical protein